MSIDLRWIEKKNWDKGKYCLQFRYEESHDWQDVPIAEESKVEEPKKELWEKIKDTHYCMGSDTAKRLVQIAKEHWGILNDE